MVTSQDLDKFLAQLPSICSWLYTGRNSRVSHSKVKEGLFREINILHKQSLGQLKKAEAMGKTHSVGRVGPSQKMRGLKTWVR